MKRVANIYTEEKYGGDFYIYILRSDTSIWDECRQGQDDTEAEIDPLCAVHEGIIRLADSCLYMDAFTADKNMDMICGNRNIGKDGLGK